MLALESFLLETIDALEIAHIHRDDHQFAAAAEGARTRLSKLVAELDCWQPIRSAPRDGTPVDLWVAESGEGRRWVSCHWDGDLGAWVSRAVEGPGELRASRITHWRAIIGPAE